jgi:DNA-directed RNA polymerase specialized sigma24 family protein
MKTADDKANTTPTWTISGLKADPHQEDQWRNLDHSLRAYISKKMPLNDDDCADIVNDTVLKILTIIQDIQSPAYIYTAVRNNALRRIREARKLQFLSAAVKPIDYGEQHNCRDKQPCMETAALENWKDEACVKRTAERLESLWETVSPFLPKSELDFLRAYITLTLGFPGIDQRDIAEALHLSPGNLKVRLHRCRKVALSILNDQSKQTNKWRTVCHVEKLEVFGPIVQGSPGLT